MFAVGVFSIVRVTTKVLSALQQTLQTRSYVQFQRTYTVDVPIPNLVFKPVKFNIISSSCVSKHGAVKTWSLKMEESGAEFARNLSLGSRWK
jgi:hypothetical protein